MRWLHEVYSCCHLDICAENVMVEFGEFNDDGSGSGRVKVDTRLRVRLIDFGVAEVFEHGFECTKDRLTLENEAYLAPEMRVPQASYDARAADMWGLGMVFFQLCVGEPLYEPDDADAMLTLLQHGELRSYLAKSGVLDVYSNNQQVLTELLLGLLEADGAKRWSAAHCSRHRWFRAYQRAYGEAIDGRMVASAQKLLQRGMSERFPFYCQVEQPIFM